VLCCVVKEVGVGRCWFGLTRIHPLAGCMNLGTIEIIGLCR
jgi:hypothetical protein